jgi:quercetin dioxygenase-like cupin family protein
LNGDFMNNDDRSDSGAGSGTAKAEAMELAGMVSYQDGSIVSRTILGQSAGSITLFAFDRGQELSEHTTPFDAVVQVLDGKVELTIGGDSLVAVAGEMVIMPANIPHAVMAVEKFKMMLIMIRS